MSQAELLPISQVARLLLRPTFLAGRQPTCLVVLRRTCQMHLRPMFLVPLRHQWQTSQVGQLPMFRTNASRLLLS